MLEDKAFFPLDMVFPFMTGFINRATGLLEQAPMKKLYTMYLYLIISLAGCKTGKVTDNVRIGELR